MMESFALRHDRTLSNHPEVHRTDLSLRESSFDSKTLSHERFIEIRYVYSGLELPKSAIQSFSLKAANCGDSGPFLTDCAIKN